MAGKVINTILNMNASGMLSGLKQVSGATNTLVGDFGRMASKGKISFNGVLGSVDRFASRATGVLAGAAGAFTAFSVSAGTEYESALAKLETIADPTQASMESLSDQILALSKETGVSAAELANTAYNAISATGDTAGAIETTAVAAKMAKGGFADTESALGILTTAQNAYKLSSEELNSVADTLINTQNTGVTTIADLSSYMGKAIATGAAYNVSMGNIESAYISMTKNGIQTAESTTYMNSVFKELGDSGSVVAKIIRDKTGKSFGQLMNDGESLGDVLGILMDSVDGDTEAMMNLWSSAEAGTGASAIISQGLDTFNQNLKDIEGNTGSAQSAYETMMDTFEGETGRLKETVNNIGIEFWTEHLSEPLSGAIGQLTDTLGSLDFTPLMDSLSEVLTGGIDLLTQGLAWLAENGDTVIPMLTGVAKGIVGLKVVTGVVGAVSSLHSGFKKLTGGTSLVTGAVKLLSNPMTAIPIIIATVIGVVIFLCTHWTKLRTGFKKFVDEHPMIVGAFKALTLPIRGVIGFVGGLVDTLKDAYNWFKNLIGVSDEANNSTSGGGGIGSGGLGYGHALGTPYFGGGWTKINERGGEIAYLPGGSMIVPHDKSVQAAASGGRSISVQVVVQGNMIGNEEYADWLGDYIVEKLDEVYA